MPYLIECAEADATLGETVDVMREVFGVYVEPLIVDITVAFGLVTIDQLLAASTKPHYLQ